jgi:hypothetical protein
MVVAAAVALVVVSAGDCRSDDAERENEKFFATET